MVHRESRGHPKRHLVPCVLSNQPMCRAHGQSETDLFHPAVAKDNFKKKYTWFVLVIVIGLCEVQLRNKSDECAPA